MPTEERQPAPLQHDARQDLLRQVGGALELVPAADSVREREQRVLGNLAGRLGPGGLDAVEALGPVGHGSVAALADVGDDGLDAAHASIRSTGTSRIERARRFESRQEAPDVGGGDERVDRDHPGLGQRDDARRARPRNQVADLPERASGAFSIR